MFLTIQAALQQGTELLENARDGVPRLTAEVLLSHALRSDRAYLYAHSDEQLTELAWIHYGRYLNDRMNGKPTQYITHHQEFYGRDFYVDERVLIPRPETEHLVSQALEYVKVYPAGVILDVGTGSGAIAASLALESSRTILASDISVAALAVATRNCRQLKAPVRLFAADLIGSVVSHSVDLICSNPPYVPGSDAGSMQKEVHDWEPHIALFAAADGMSIYRRLIPEAARVLRPGGRLIMELGHQSLPGVREILAIGWHDIQIESDLAGWPRVIAATRPG